jgi:glycosidase
MTKLSIALILLVTIVGCERSTHKDSIADELVPEWSRNIVWYQIFPERFRNGDTANDPRPKDMRMTYPEKIPLDWTVTDWTADWYQEDSWMEELNGVDFSSKLQLRRYGGDLQGVLDKLDYLEDLGITGVYFNPLNDAPSLHKYDPRHWRHIDRNFGSDPDGDALLIAGEIPDDPDTWLWTAADSMFLQVITELHKRDIRVIMDFSWNHTGYDFWAVNDIREKGKESRFQEWYEVQQFDDITTLEDETEIAGWWGFKYLPLIKENVLNEDSQMPHEGNVASETFKQHIFNVSQRWLDPNGDENFQDGVDGFRMDVASEMTMGWWRDYRQFVKSVNPEALLVGEVWWFDWPDLRGPEKMVQGDQFDALMNYRWFALSSGLFKQANPQIKPSEFVQWYDSLVEDIAIENQQVMMNIVATHDTPRLSTSMFNPNRFDQGSKVSENPDYKIHRPDNETWDLLKTYLLHQYSFVGSPHIWNGDEFGMWGANDPDCRKPLWWDDIEFELEIKHPTMKRKVTPDTVRQNKELLAYYKQLIRLRTNNPVLSLGSLEYVLTDDERMLFGYSRKLGGKEAFAVFNLSNEDQEIALEVNSKHYNDALSEEAYQSKNGKLNINIPSKRGKLLLSN